MKFSSYESGIKRLEPHGTNSTMFTSCCEVAITSSECVCPKCGNNVIGHDAESDAARARIRWMDATGHWVRR